MKQRMLCILLTLCMVLSMAPVFGASASSGGGGGSFAGGGSTAAAYSYGVISEVWYDDYTLEENHVEISIAIPSYDYWMDWDWAVLQLPATIGGRTYTTAEAVQAALPIGTAVRYTIDEINLGDYWTDGITFIEADTTGVPYTNVTYNKSTGLFQNLSAATKNLPVFFFSDYGDGDVWVDPVYLDGQHIYNILVYDYAILVTEVRAINYATVIDYAMVQNFPDGNFLSDIEFYVTAYAPGGTLHAEIYDDRGNKLQSQTTSFGDYECRVLFENLEDVYADRTIKAWITRGNSQISPVYEFVYIQHPFEIVSGTVLETTPRITSWDECLIVRLREEYGNWTSTAKYHCYLPCWVGDTLCTTAAQLQAFLPVGTEISMALGDSVAFQLGVPTPEPNAYGMIAKARVEDDAWGGDPSVFVRMVLPTGGYVDYLLSENLLKDEDDLDAYCDSILGTCCMYAEQDGVIVALDLDRAAQTKRNQRYSTTTGTFPGISADLPVYSMVNTTSATLELSPDALYDIKVYDYGVVVYAVKDGSIDYINGAALINENFRQDLSFLYQVEQTGAAVLKAQLLTANNKVLERCEIANPNGDVCLDFYDYPNKDADYQIKLWLEDESGNRIGAINNQSYTVREKKVASGIIESAWIDSSRSGMDYLVLDVKIPGTNNTTQLFCHPWTSVNKTTYDEDFDSALSNLQAALPIGTLIEYVVEDATVSVIRYSKKQQVVTNTQVSGNSVSASVYIASNDGQEATGTVYAGLYSADDVLKKIVLIPDVALTTTAGTVLDVDIDDVAYVSGDYVKVLYWTGNNHAISNVTAAPID